MTAYLLDTNHASPLVTVGHPFRERIFAHHQLGDTFGIAAPALNEFLFGIATLPRSQSNLREWEHMKHEFTFYAVTPEDAEKAFGLRLTLRQRGRQLDLVDSFVAIVALRYALVLLTKDKDFLAVPGLKLENWL